MGHYVHIHLAFSCDRNEGVAALAKKHLPLLTTDSASDDYCIEAIWFLESLSERTGYNPGPKGGLSLWGITGNYTRGDEFVRVLLPFWKELLVSEVDGGPFNFERIVVFEEHEQSVDVGAGARAFEIRLVDDSDKLPAGHHAEPRIEVRTFECPFAWHQC